MHRNHPATLAFCLLVLGSVLTTSTGTAEEPRKIVSWNAYSPQFIQAPEFTLLVLPKTALYRATVQQGDQSWTVESKHPQVSLASVWDKLATKRFSLRLEWCDTQGAVLASETSSRVKAPGWSGFQGPPADWVAAADRNMAYLFEMDRQRTAPYCEPGVPIWVWSAATPTTRSTEFFTLSPQGLPLGYPCNTIPQTIWGLLAYVQAERPEKDHALQLATAGADWALKNRQPNSGALPLFPFSTVSLGKFAGGVEGKAVNLPRASYLGVSFVDLYRVTQDERYLDYARHIATVSARFQRPDGSFPYRVDAESGKVTEGYSPCAAEFALLVDALTPYGVEPKLLLQAKRAIQWLTTYAAGTNHWQAAFEDIPEQLQYRNLSQYEAQELIPYLCRHRDEDPSYLPLAKRLNAWIEDQFVVFGPESESWRRPIQGPLVIEQYVCWAPMEGHTGRWVLTLLELHRASGDPEYLDKAKAACNAICSQQFSNGAFSTFADRTWVDGHMTGDDLGGNWYNANMDADAALYTLDSYLRNAETKPE